MKEDIIKIIDKYTNEPEPLCDTFKQGRWWGHYDIIEDLEKLIDIDESVHWSEYLPGAKRRLEE